MNQIRENIKAMFMAYDKEILADMLANVLMINMEACMNMYKAEASRLNDAFHQVDRQLINDMCKHPYDINKIISEQNLKVSIEENVNELWKM